MKICPYPSLLSPTVLSHWKGITPCYPQDIDEGILQVRKGTEKPSGEGQETLGIANFQMRRITEKALTLRHRGGALI